MAGAGYKLFNTGDVLTAAQVNTYLQEQAVMRFANSTARTTALSGVLAEGMMSYLDDTNSVEVYNGSAWVSVGSTGDIEGVTAGVGISGGGTSGTVTITNDMATTITAAGDIVVGTGSGTYDNLPIGTTGQVLTADTTVSPYKVKWAAAAGGGKVLQVVSSSINTNTQIASTSLTDTNITASITPSATNSKILVMITAPFNLSRSSTTGNYAGLALLRGATSIQSWDSGEGNPGLSTGSTTNFLAATVAIVYLDSPNTTSSTTYKLQAKVDNTANSAFIRFMSGGNSPANITLLEIGA